MHHILNNTPEHQAIDLKDRAGWSDMYGVTGEDEADVYGSGIFQVELSKEDRRIIRSMPAN
jgi:hypothetical protein